MAAKTESEVLAATDDEYGGVMVHINEYGLLDSATFLSSLTSSIAHWKLQGKKGVWIKLPIRHVNLVEAAVKVGQPPPINYYSSSTYLFNLSTPNDLIAARILVPPCGA